MAQNPLIRLNQQLHPVVRAIKAVYETMDNHRDITIELVIKQDGQTVRSMVEKVNAA